MQVWVQSSRINTQETCVKVCVRDGSSVVSVTLVVHAQIIQRLASPACFSLTDNSHKVKTQRALVGRASVTHTHTHTQSHTHTHTHTLARSLTHTHTDTHTHTHSHTHTHTQTRTHTHAHAHTNIHTHTQNHTGSLLSPSVFVSLAVVTVYDSLVASTTRSALPYPLSVQESVCMVLKVASKIRSALRMSSSQGAELVVVPISRPPGKGGDGSG